MSEANRPEGEPAPAPAPAPEPEPAPAAAPKPEPEPAAEPASAPLSALELAWVRAEAHSLAAAALLDDPSVPPWTAAHHLRRGFSALAEAAGVPSPKPAAQLDPSTLPWVGSPQATADALVHLGDDDRLIELSVLRQLSAALSGAVRNAEDDRFAPQRRRARRRRWLRRAAMGLMVLAPVVAVLALTVPDYREGPWRAELYATKDLSGEPIVRRDGDLKFDWQRRSPHRDLPDDGFSARWDTCMVLDEDLEVAFQLISDDGSRLWLDGEEVVDNWGRHGERSRGADVTLSAGVHHLRIDYFDERHAAMLELRASLHGEPPDSLPVRILRYPGDELDPSDPCASAR